MDDQKRFITAMVLSGLILGAYYFFFAKPITDQARLQAQTEMVAAAQQIQTRRKPPSYNNALI